MIIVSFQFITILVHVFYNVNKGLDTFLFLVSFNIFFKQNGKLIFEYVKL